MPRRRGGGVAQWRALRTGLRCSVKLAFSPTAASGRRGSVESQRPAVAHTRVHCRRGRALPGDAADACRVFQRQGGQGAQGGGGARKRRRTSSRGGREGERARLVAVARHGRSCSERAERIDSGGAEHRAGAHTRTRSRCWVVLTLFSPSFMCCFQSCAGLGAPAPRLRLCVRVCVCVCGVVRVSVVAHEA